MRTINRIYIHESASKYGNALLINYWHKLLKWGIKLLSINNQAFIISGGYHYIISNQFPYSVKEGYPFLDGCISMMRPLDRTGAGVYGDNRSSIHICIIKNSDQKPSVKQWNSLINICTWLVKKYSLTPDDVLGHREYFLKVRKPPLKNEDIKKSCPDVDMDSVRQEVKTMLRLID